jgi:hypothetical protein
MNDEQKQDQSTPSCDKEKLQQLQSLLIDNVLSILKEGKPLKAGMLTAIRQLLKDQGVKAASMTQRELQDSLSDLNDYELPVFDDDED